MSQIDDVIDQLNGLGSWAQWGVGIIATLLTIIIVRLLMKKVILDIVKKTAFDWDDKLYSPVTKRVYLFILFAGTNLTMKWVLGEGDSLVDSFNPFFMATYIFLSTSLTSVVLRTLIPVIMDRYSDPSSVTVSGSNSLTGRPDCP